MKPENTRPWKYKIAGRGSTVVDTLEAVWEALRRIEHAIPRAVLTLVDSRSRRRLRGYFAHSTWKKRKGAAHEIAISPSLIGDPFELLATMLHEAAHAILFENGNHGGMGSTPYYHTTVFREQCLQLGLSCEFWNTRYGWSLTSWPALGIPERFKPMVKILRKGLPAGTGGRATWKIKGKKLPVTGHTMLVCECEEGDRTVYVKKSMLEAGGIICSFCGQEFLPIGLSR